MTSVTPPWLRLQAECLRRSQPGNAAAFVHDGFRFPFRVAEAPAFIPQAQFDEDLSVLRARLLPLLTQEFLSAARRAVPERFRAAVPRRPQFFATDYARAVDAQGRVWHPMPELQSFPGNYFLWQALAPDACTMLGLRGGAESWRGLGRWSGMDGAALLRRCVLRDADPSECAIVEVTPTQQKTFVDALLMARTLGVPIVDVADITLSADGSLETRRWLEVGEGAPVERRGLRRVRRVHSRCLPQELDEVLSADQIVRLFRESARDGAVSFSAHPEDYFLLSKATLCGTTLVPELLAADTALPARLRALGLTLADGVLKPVDGAGGSGVLGVRAALTEADLRSVIVDEGQPPRSVWQRRYESFCFERPGFPALSAGGLGLQQELRVMWLLPADAHAPVPAGTMVRWSDRGVLANAGSARSAYTGTQCVLVGDPAGWPA